MSPIIRLESTGKKGAGDGRQPRVVQTIGY